MPQLIQRAPVGMLSLLDSKAGGQAPNILLDEVRASFDIEPLFGIGARGSLTASITAATIGAGVGVFAIADADNIPAGVGRHVRYLGVNTDTTPAAAYEFWVGWYIERINRFVPHGSGSGPLNATRGTAGGACDFWWVPGIRPALYIGNNGGAVNMSLNVIFESVSF